jgi:hypothetical protein
VPAAFESLRNLQSRVSDRPQPVIGQAKLAAGKQSFDVHVREALPASLARRRKRLRAGQFIVANLLEVLEDKGRPSTIAQQPLSAIAVGAFASDRSVQGETSAMV